MLGLGTEKRQKRGKWDGKKSAEINLCRKNLLSYFAFSIQKNTFEAVNGSYL